MEEEGKVEEGREVVMEEFVEGEMEMGKTEFDKEVDLELKL